VTPTSNRAATCLASKYHHPALCKTLLLLRSRLLLLLPPCPFSAFHFTTSRCCRWDCRLLLLLVLLLVKLQPFGWLATHHKTPLPPLELKLPPGKCIKPPPPLLLLLLLWVNIHAPSYSVELPHQPILQLAHCMASTVAPAANECKVHHP
jgi:hypothetical protein